MSIVLSQTIPFTFITLSSCIFSNSLKNFSDRQIYIEKKLIDYVIKRIDRSYSKISEFIYKIDELSLKKKKPIDLKTIKEII